MIGDANPATADHSAVAYSPYRRRLVPGSGCQWPAADPDRGWARWPGAPHLPAPPPRPGWCQSDPLGHL